MWGVGEGVCLYVDVGVCDGVEGRVCGYVYESEGRSVRQCVGVCVWVCVCGSVHQ